MKTATIAHLDVATLGEQWRNALAILGNIPLEDFNDLKSIMHLSDPGVIGPTTLQAFVDLCTDKPLSLNLTAAGINAFKDGHHLGNTGILHGIIGPQTAQVYYTEIMSGLKTNGTNGARRINAAGLDLVKEFEGYQRQVPGTTDVTAYRDPIGILTIGYGHTGPDVTPGLTITQSAALALLQQDLSTAESGVERLVTVSLNDNEFSALVSFAFNLGLGTLAGSTLLRLLNGGDHVGAADEFLRFKYAGGQVLEGLVRRRDAERQLFLA